MNRIEKLNTDPLNGRDLYFWELDHHSELEKDINLSSLHYICFVAWNAENKSVDEISNLAEILIKSGASYICAWGANCELVHDIIDEIDALSLQRFRFP